TGEASKLFGRGGWVARHQEKSDPTFRELFRQCRGGQLSAQKAQGFGRGIVTVEHSGRSLGGFFGRGFFGDARDFAAQQAFDRFDRSSARTKERGFPVA